MFPSGSAEGRNMSTSRKTPIPPWQPDRVLEELARESGQSVRALQSEIRETAPRVTATNHLLFETLRRGEFSADERGHLDACEFCQDLYEAIHPTDAVFDGLERLLAENGTPVHSHTEATQEKEAAIARLEKERARRPYVPMAIAASLVALVIGGWGGARFNQARDPLNSLSADSRYSVARALAEDGQYPQANEVLLTALERGGIDKPTLRTVSTVLETRPASGRARRIEALHEATRLEAALREQRDQKPAEILELSERQFESGQWINGYESLGSYLKTVRNASPAAVAFETKFVAQLPDEPAAVSNP